MSKFAKRLLYVSMALVLVVVLSVFGFAQEQVEEPIGYEAECYKHGDMNADGAIDNLDAFYTLYHMMFPEEYPLRQEQNWDFDKNGTKDNVDAFHVLYHVMFREDPDFAELYQLDGVVHDYFDPSWVWTEDAGTVTAQVTFKCGCGAPTTYTQATGVTVTAGIRVEATCMQAGSAPYTARIEVDGTIYENTYTQVIPASGSHSMVGTQDCENSSVCGSCGFTLAAKGHSWVLNAEKTTAATCVKQAVQWYDCSACGNTKEVELEGTTGHALQYLEDRQEGCKFVKWYKCSVCQEEFAGTAASDTYYKHDYKAALTKEATCAQSGQKTYTCVCGDTYTEEVPANDSHDWVAGTPDANGVTTHTCSRGCGATKTTVSATKDTAVKTEDLQNNELQLDNNASMKLDQDTVDALEQDIKVSVETVDPETAGLDEEKIAQLGDSKVYDFNMTYADGSAITEEGTVFAGEVTISLPYTLSEGEDVDSIHVWYIDDNGTLTAVEATYSNGFVTFTTGHFSYYTVTRLTPAQRCELYGHTLVHTSKAVTCTQDGYEMSVCSRCGDVAKNDVKASKGHAYGATQVIKAASCIADGSFKKVCGNCQDTVTGIIPATGHSMTEDTALAQAASCTQAGKVVNVCTNGCGHTTVEEIPQLSHNYKEGEAKAADCTNKGYQQKTCQLCGDTVIYNEQAPLGHSFSQKNAHWAWNDTHTAATVTLACDHNGTHTKELTAVVTEKKVAPSCTDAGTVTYTATASFNEVTYTDSYQIYTDSVGHTPDDSQWLTTEKTHYHLCMVCEGRADEIAHQWNEGVVNKEATCGEAGSATYTCVVCDYEAEKTIPATKKHTFQDGVCTECGAQERTCLHGRKTEEIIDLSMYDICEGAELIKRTCECGEEVEYEWDLNCRMSEEEERIEIDENGEKIYIYSQTCEDCGLTYEYYDFAQINEDECVKNYAMVERLFLGETVVMEYQWIGMGMPHPGVEVIKKTTFTEEDGLCGTMIFEERVCPCGEVTSTYIPEWNCDMQYNEPRKGVCVDCGLVELWEYTYDEVACGELETYTASFYMGETLLYTYSNVSKYEEHDYKAADYELFGTSCEDGIAIYAVCRDCGHETSYYTERDEHFPVIEGYIDLSEYDLCVEGVRTLKCPCEYTYEVFMWETDDGSEGCEMRDTVENPDGTVTQSCPVCGLAAIITYTKTEKDEHCGYFEIFDVTLALADGTPLGQVCMRAYLQDHELESTYELNGMTCADGVTITTTCVNCDYTDVEKRTYCSMTIYETYDLSDSGICTQQVMVNRCPCGRNININGLWYSGCDWQYAAGDEGVEVYRCSCGAELEDRRAEPVPTDDPCYNKQQRSYTIRKAGEELLKLQWTELLPDHNLELELQMNEGATDCSQGYTWYEYCLDCDYENRGASDYHQKWYAGSQAVGDGKLCSNATLETYSCACGKQQHNELVWEGKSCNFEQKQWFPATNTYVYECLDCGAQYVETYEEARVEGESCLRLCTRSYYYSDAEGNNLFSYQDISLGEIHRYIYTLSGDSCETGYDAYGECVDCDEISEYKDYRGCNGGWEVERETVLEPEGTCGPVEKVHTVCLCGNYDYYDISFASCNMVCTDYDPEFGDIYTCSDCGLEYYSYTDTEDGDGCEMIYQEVYVLTFGGETRTITIETVTYNHNYLHTFAEKENGGYYIYGDCTDCDATETDEIDACEHGLYLTQDLHLEDLDICGGEVRVSICPCGEDSYVYWDVSYCSLIPTGNYHPELGIMEMVCMDCDTILYWDEQTERVPGTCRVEGMFYFIAIRDGEELANIAAPIGDVEHDTYYTNLALRNPEGTCQDGVTYTVACRYCDYAYEDWSYSHVAEEIEYVNLKGMGACSGYMVYGECLCGAYVGVEKYETCPNLETTNWEQQEDDGYTHYYQEESCKDCGLRILSDRYAVKRQGACLDDWHITYTVIIGEETRKISYVETQECHDWDYTYTLPEGVTSCEDGVIETGVCAQCGTTSEQTYWYHKEGIGTHIDLSSIGACGGTIDYSRCACEENQTENYNYQCETDNVQTEYTDEQGRKHNVWTYTCKDCGLVICQDGYEVRNADTCTADRYTSVTITRGEFATGFEVHHVESAHDMALSLKLAEGSTTCLDGVEYTYACRDCEFSYGGTTYYHQTYEVAKYDLCDYGALCGGTLKLWNCACGENASHEFADMECELDYIGAENFIEGAIVDSQYGMYSYANLYKCAVTDPEACPLVIRCSNYWLRDPETCIATNYATFQLGYNEEDGTYLEEVTYAYKDTRGYHAFTETSTTETLADSSTLAVTSKICDGCGSSHIIRDYYHAEGYSLKHEEIFTNTLDNGEDIYKEIVYEWEMQPYGRNEQSRYLHKTINANGEEFWNEERFAYDPADPCHKTCFRNNSLDLEGTTTVLENHGGTAYYEYVDSCSQNCYDHRWSVCSTCGETYGESWQAWDPAGHRWAWNDELGLWVCVVCGLENENGADGDVVLEELTEGYGEGVNYVVGYWNKTNLSFDYHLSVILEDVTEGDNQIDLEFGAFTVLSKETDGINAVAFNAEHANSVAAAAVAQAGYTGNYALRISFVPMGGGTLDYAITFDSVAAQ